MKYLLFFLSFNLWAGVTINPDIDQFFYVNCTHPTEYTDGRPLPGVMVASTHFFVSADFNEDTGEGTFNPKGVSTAYCQMKYNAEQFADGKYYFKMKTQTRDNANLSEYSSWVKVKIDRTYITALPPRYLSACQ